MSDPAGPGHRRDRPVGHPTSTAARHLEVLPPARDGLLVLLAGAAGGIDVLSYLRLGNVFTANMTGNAVLLGIATGQHVGARALHSAVALAGFVLGVLAGAALCGRHQGSQTGGWPPGVTLALGVELVLLAALAVGWALAGADPAGRAEDGLVGIAALAMGLQSAAVARLPLDGVATTYVTGTLTGLLFGLVLGSDSRRDRLRRVGVLLGLVGGAVVAAVVVGAAGAVAALIPVALVAVVVAVAVRARPASPDSG
jgi:uncharacterized membrane protein YoaK (UPF0700 family)